MKLVLQLLLVFAVAACNNVSKSDEVIVKDSVALHVKTADSATNYIHIFTDTALENKITKALLELPFVKKSDLYIDSFSKHKQGITFLLDKPANYDTEIHVQAGYNGDERFETYYRFFVNQKTMEIKVYDVVADKKLTVKEFIKSQR